MLVDVIGHLGVVGLSAAVNVLAEIKDETENFAVN